jgi:hypothetical protein
MAEAGLDDHPIGKVVFHQQQIHPIIPRQPPSHSPGRSNHYADTDGFMKDFETAREGCESAIGAGDESQIGN